jgi:hypothetical protein
MRACLLGSVGLASHFVWAAKETHWSYWSYSFSFNGQDLASTPWAFRSPSSSKPPPPPPQLAPAASASPASEDLLGERLIMRFAGWYLKIAAVGASIGAAMELFMIHTGFCTLLSPLTPYLLSIQSYPLLFLWDF